MLRRDAKDNALVVKSEEEWQELQRQWEEESRAEEENNTQPNIPADRIRGRVRDFMINQIIEVWVWNQNLTEYRNQTERKGGELEGRWMFARVRETNIEDETLPVQFEDQKDDDFERINTRETTMRRCHTKTRDVEKRTVKKSTKQKSPHPTVMHLCQTVITTRTPNQNQTTLQY